MHSAEIISKRNSKAIIHNQEAEEEKKTTTNTNLWLWSINIIDLFDIIMNPARQSICVFA